MKLDRQGGTPPPASSRRCVVVTGASSGIGLASAEAFARMGWHVIATGRDEARCEAARIAIEGHASSEARVDFLRADFTETRDVRRIAGEIAALTDRIDVLVNNAGGVRDDLYRTSEGLEATFAANHLAPFILTRELMPLLQAAARDNPGMVRVIAVSSSAHHACPQMQWDDLMLFANFSASAAYCQAKLANLLFTRALARRLEGSGVVTLAMHPGRVGSNFASHGDAAMQSYMAANDCVSPQQPARTIVWLAMAPELSAMAGRYFHDLEEEQPASQALDDTAAERLWQESEALIACCDA